MDLDLKELNPNIRKTIDTWFETKKHVEDACHVGGDYLHTLHPRHRFEGWIEDVQLYIDP